MAEKPEPVFTAELDRIAPASPWRRFFRGAYEVAFILVAALLLSILVKTFLVRSFYIPSESMRDTLMVNDRIMVNELAPNIMPLHRGDIVVFNDPGGWLEPVQTQPNALKTVLTFIGLYPADAGEQVVKRVIGLPGDHIQCCGADGRLTINGAPIDETYLRPGAKPSEFAFDVTVPKDRLWVMGDNRSNSRDSRYHQDEAGGGSIPESSVVGRVFVINWPLDHLHWFTRPESVFSGVGSP